MPGWLAQWQEMLEDKEQKISRPRQVYTGCDKRDYVPIKERSLAPAADPPKAKSAAAAR
jgi:citrate synthase